MQTYLVPLLSQSQAPLFRIKWHLGTPYYKLQFNFVWKFISNLWKLRVTSLAKVNEECKKFKVRKCLLLFPWKICFSQFNIACSKEYTTYVDRPLCICNVMWCVVCGVWCVVCGVWCVVCGVWCVVCGVWCVVCGVWCVVCSVCCMMCVAWCVLYDLCCQEMMCDVSRRVYYCYPGVDCVSLLWDISFFQQHVLPCDQSSYSCYHHCRFWSPYKSYEWQADVCEHASSAVQVYLDLHMAAMIASRPVDLLHEILAINILKTLRSFQSLFG